MYQDPLFFPRDLAGYASCSWLASTFTRPPIFTGWARTVFPRLVCPCSWRHLFIGTYKPVFAGSFLIAKKLTETESSTSIVAFLSIIVTLVLLPPALLSWRTPTWSELGLLFAVASLATAGHFTLTQAFKCAEITVTQPAQFLQLIWATLLGLLVFGEQPVLWTWVGGAIIVASVTYIAHRETRQKKETAPLAARTNPLTAGEGGER